MIHKATDPVCNMEVDVTSSTPKSEYMGKAFYFCSVQDKVEFEKHPARYAVKEKAQEVAGKK